MPFGKRGKLERKKGYHKKRVRKAQEKQHGMIIIFCIFKSWQHFLHGIWKVNNTKLTVFILGFSVSVVFLRIFPYFLRGRREFLHRELRRKEKINKCNKFSLFDKNPPFFESWNRHSTKPTIFSSMLYLFFICIK
jgi:hypothetical protein